MRRALLALVVLGLGCDVEPRPRPVFDAGVEPMDADVVVDADAGTCLDDAAVCGAGHSCVDGACEETAVCGTTPDCLAPKVCHLTGTSTVGSCALAEGECVTGPCPTGQHCSAGGVCVNALSEDGELDVRCQTSGDCGPTGLCSGGVCVACSEQQPCAGGLECQAGYCLEPFTCDSADDCVGSNTCIGGSCVRSTSGCTADPLNDVSAGASSLVEATVRRSICGDDVDYYRLQLEAGEGARLRLEYAPEAFTLLASVEDEDGFGLEVAQLDLPGFTLIEVPASDTAQTLLLSVSSLDASGSYTLSFDRVDLFCVRDIFDLYGDADPATAPVVLPESSYDLVGCTGDTDARRVPLSAGDTLSVRVQMDERGSRFDLALSDEMGSVALESSVEAENADEARSGGASLNAGTWTVALTPDRAPTVGQPYTLDLRRALGTRTDACASPTPLSGTVQLDLAASDLGQAPCGFGLAGGPDRIFRVAPVAEGRLARVTARPGASSDLVSLAVLTDCADDGSAVVCDPAVRGRAASVEWIGDGAERFVLLSADTSTRTQRPAELSLTVDEADNFSCLGNRATPLLMSAEQPVDTFGATNSVELETFSSCGNTGLGAGSDRFFSLSLGAGERAVVELSGDPGGFLWVGTDCQMMTETCTAADSLDGGRPAAVVLQPSRATNFLVAVDGQLEGDAGQYSLRTIFDPECVRSAECGARACDGWVCTDAPQNDACPGNALVVTAGSVTTVAGSTGAARDDLAGSCGGSGQLDVVYRVELPAGLPRLRARVTQAAFDSLLHIRRGTCGAAVSEIACEDDESYPTDLRPDITLEAPEAGTYFFVIDAYQGAGSYTFELDPT